MFISRELTRNGAKPDYILGTDESIGSNMNIEGSQAAPGYFYPFMNAGESRFEIHEMLFYIQDNVAINLLTFGGQPSPLRIGIDFGLGAFASGSYGDSAGVSIDLVQDLTGLGFISKTADLYRFCDSVSFPGTNASLVVGRLNFAKAGAPIQHTRERLFYVKIQDDLQSLAQMGCVVRGIIYENNT